MLERLSIPIPCEDCNNMAYWAWDSYPMCYHHLRGMAEMNSDNEAAVYNALISPVVCHSSNRLVILSIYPTTSIAAICALLNQLDQETEICISLLEEGDGRQVCKGRGYFSIESATTGYHAPLIKTAGTPLGRMAGFMKMLNDHSRRIRQYVAQEQEFGKEIPNA